MNFIAYASPLTESSLVAREDSSSVEVGGPVPPGIPITETDPLGAKSKAVIPWQAMVSLNPYINPDMVPPGAVVKLPPGTFWIARPGETILTVAKHFVKCATTYSYTYGAKPTLDPYALAQMNYVYSISAPLPPGRLIRLPPDSGYLAFSQTKFAFIANHLSFAGPYYF